MVSKNIKKKKKDLFDHGTVLRFVSFQFKSGFDSEETEMVLNVVHI